ncbi:30S ribosomal protein S21 [Candidatus Beckwithbacteria bacterium CG10_big_fil_rev_8_21_14_0_10_34_10]|uniref:Small ribosomal subunit protein bS21 n=1 Tax=Candidatus Beckwithbacteria bacterium CG10_big_fil_rev_8_21_14_0_10_34_10 TaxID=1974495 RepID=A0A2H0WBQ2_9BACT|nr:MAG: 30S ribosomal protein S21 [Candidatus Beckwithbacteria bacterium CG10_big_fil_rev_8_21_14_0_10_34_10]
MATIVKAQPGDNAGQVIRKFKKKVQQDQILTTIREREFYKKPSVLKKEKLTEMRRKNKRRPR